MKLRFLLIFIIWVAGFEAFALNVTGQFFKDRGLPRVAVDEGNARAIYFIVAGNKNVASVLSQLKSFDHITGTGELRDNDTIILQTIDFVALRRLLGVWESPHVRVNFLNYTNVTIDFWSLSLNIKAKYNYAVSPGPANTWRMYFTDEDSVTLGVLSVNSIFATLEIFDPETGEVSHTYRLQKSLFPTYEN